MVRMSKQELIDMIGDVVAEKMEENVRIEEVLNADMDLRPLTKTEKMILLSLKDIESIQLGGNSVIELRVKSLNMNIDINTGDMGVDDQSRIITALRNHFSYNNTSSSDKVIIYALWRFGLLKYKTSPCKVTIQLPSGFRSSINIATLYDDQMRRNPHDWGYNCWGGWSSKIKQQLEEGSPVDAFVTILERLKQINLFDVAAGIDKLLTFRTEFVPEFVMPEVTTALDRALLDFMMDSRYTASRESDREGYTKHILRLRRVNQDPILITIYKRIGA